MPSVDLARPGAERRAHAAALGKLRTALATLPLGGGRTLRAAEIERALGRARTIDTQYQSNGGAVVRLEVRFADWLAPKEPPIVTLAVPAMRLGAAPAASVGRREIVVGAAIFHLGAAPAGTERGRRQGRSRRAISSWPETGIWPPGSRGGVAQIYVQKVQK